MQDDQTQTENAVPEQEPLAEVAPEEKVVETLENEIEKTNPTPDVGPEPIIQTSDTVNVDVVASLKSDLGQEPEIEIEVESPTPAEPEIKNEPVQIEQIENPSTELGASKTIEKSGDTVTITEVMTPPLQQTSAGQATFPAPFKPKDLWSKFLNKISERKTKKLEKIMQRVNKNGKVTNDDIEKLLHVSDATATRYLDQLEKEGKLKQIGKTGKYTYYTKI